MLGQYLRLVQQESRDTTHFGVVWAYISGQGYCLFGQENENAQGTEKLRYESPIGESLRENSGNKESYASSVEMY